MVDKDSEEQKRVLLDSIKETGEQAKTIEKLLKDRVEVEIAENQDELDILELDESRLKYQMDILEKKGGDGLLKETGEIAKSLDEIGKRRVDISAKIVRAYLTPLKYREYRIVQTAVVEALISTESMNFDMDTRIAMVMQEKKMMIVYLSLRKYGNLSERFYTSLEEFVKTSDRTIDKLYSTYVSEFEIGEKERKN